MEYLAKFIGYDGSFPKSKGTALLEISLIMFWVWHPVNGVRRWPPEPALPCGHHRCRLGSMGILRPTAFFLAVLAVLALACGGATPLPNPTPAEYPVATYPTMAPGRETPSAPAATPHATPAPTATSSPTPAGSFPFVWLELTSRVLEPGRQFWLDVRLDPRGHSISGVQFDLRFPPQEVEVLEVSPGPLLGAGPLEIKGPGNAVGVFRYAAARSGEATPPSPPERLATIRLRVLGGVAPGTPLRVWLQDVKVAEPAGDTFRAVVEVTVSPPLTFEMPHS